MSLVELMFKTDALPREQRNTMAYYAMDYITDMITSMLNTRLDEISSKPNAPFAGASTGYGNFFLANTKDAFTLDVMGNNPDLAPALAAAYREGVRAVRNRI